MAEQILTKFETKYPWMKEINIILKVLGHQGASQKAKEWNIWQI